jgi:hypothetical protein
VDQLIELLPLILPLIAIQMALIVIALLDLRRPERKVRGGSKAVWVVVIIFISMLGPLLYFVLGREEA